MQKFLRTSDDGGGDAKEASRVALRSESARALSPGCFLWNHKHVTYATSLLHVRGERTRADTGGVSASAPHP